MAAEAAEGRFPKGIDVFRHKFFGLFYVAPAQNAFMCRLRIPNGILAAHQLRGLAAIAERCGGGYADVTTRANLQIREIAPQNIRRGPDRASRTLGLTSRGAGADNIRNITGSPTAGIDPQELIDTRPLARALHHYILNHRELYGLPRKFNIAFDGGGTIGVLEDTNDIGFAAVAAPEADAACRPASISACSSAASPATAISRATPACCSSPRNACRWRSPSCACSSRMATAPTASGRASNTCSTPGASRNSWRR